MNHIKPIKVKSLPGYNIWIKFSDGTEGNVDLSYLKGKGIFSFWDIDRNFEKVYIDKETNAIAWSREIEIDSFNIYLKIIGKSYEEWKADQLTHASN